MTIRNPEDMTITECYDALDRAVDELKYTINHFIVPTYGHQARANDVVSDCDDIIDMCALIIEKTLNFERVRTGASRVSVI